MIEKKSVKGILKVHKERKQKSGGKKIFKQQREAQHKDNITCVKSQRVCSLRRFCSTPSSVTFCTRGKQRGNVSKKGLET